MTVFTQLLVIYVEKNLDIMKPRYSEQILSVPRPSLYRGSTVFCLVFIHGSFAYHLRLVHRVTFYLFLKRFHCINGKSIFFCL